VAAAPGVAHAGRSFFGWLSGSEVMPERSVELQTWVQEENRIDDEADRSESVWGVSPQIGVTDQLELGLPLEVLWARTPSGGGDTSLSSYGIEGRYRLVTQDPEEAPAFAPLIHASVERLVLARDTLHAKLGVVSTYEVGGTLIAAQLNVAVDATREEAQFSAYPAVGASFSIVGDLRAGAEAFGRYSFDSGDGRWSAGPNLAWTHGRFWMSVAYGIGLKGIKDAPRMQWGIAF